MLHNLLLKPEIGMPENSLGGPNTLEVI